MADAHSPPPDNPVSTGDRLSFTVFIALALHGFLIFGIVFELSQPSDSAPSVTVTLAMHQSSEAPDEADFVAQANQIGSGTLDESRQMTTDQLSPFANQTIEEAQLVNATPASMPTEATTTPITSKQSDTHIKKQHAQAKQTAEKTGDDKRDQQSLTEEIASLSAKLDRQRQAYAKRPRERVLTSVSAKSSRDAAYLNEWTRKVELVGNRHFPEEAIKQKMTGSLRLQSVINWDGSLLEAKLLQTSGHAIFDNAALQIIRRAAPFLPFPPEIRKDTDQLVIIRTWHFEIDGLSTSQ